MVLGASLAALGLSAGGIVVLGAAASPFLFEALALTGVVSAFVLICSTEARLAA